MNKVHNPQYYVLSLLYDLPQNVLENISACKWNAYLV